MTGTVYRPTIGTAVMNATSTCSGPRPSTSQPRRWYSAELASQSANSAASLASLIPRGTSSGTSAAGDPAAGSVARPDICPGSDATGAASGGWVTSASAAAP